MRPWHTFVLFGAALMHVAGRVGWISWTAIELDRSQAEARRQAQVEESIRLALWRMDSAVAPLLARENARPAVVYTAFHPAQRACAATFGEPLPGEALEPSPLLAPGDDVLLYFQFAPDGSLGSPQVPPAHLRERARALVPSQDFELAARRLETLRGFAERRLLVRALESVPPPPRLPREDESQLAWNLEDAQGNGSVVEQRQVQSLRNKLEYSRRSMTLQQNFAANMPQRLDDEGLAGLARTPSPPEEGVMAPVFLGDALLLARRGRVGSGEYVQGLWLDWGVVQKRLLAELVDLLPGARLEPVGLAVNAEDGARRLATLPVRLVPPPLPALPLVSSDGLLTILLFAWAGFALAAVAVAALLVGTVSLSERRATFVSAVTHELRTPLTTFRMYTEMLCEGMVADPAKRQGYLETLQREALRLSHLVENVLAYARIERGRAGGRTETLALGDVFQRLLHRLEERARQAGMEVVAELPETLAGQRVRTDASAVEQVLFNLVDNACKYAARAEDRRIHLTASREGRRAVVRVFDHGPGISPEERRRLFSPFSKSAQRAALSAPGVGLGLALRRRLARSMGGDLRIEAKAGAGACFALVLPIDPSARSEGVARPSAGQPR